MKKQPTTDKFSDDEAKERFVAALRGARVAGHKPMESLTPKRVKAQPKKRAKPKMAGG
jgi:hypothetical protein